MKSRGEVRLKIVPLIAPRYIVVPSLSTILLSGREKKRGWRTRERTYDMLLMDCE
jgi:hypothetical protein